MNDTVVIRDGLPLLQVPSSHFRDLSNLAADASKRPFFAPSEPSRPPRGSERVGRTFATHQATPALGSRVPTADHSELDAPRIGAVGGLAFPVSVTAEPALTADDDSRMAVSEPRRSLGSAVSETE